MQRKAGVNIVVPFVHGSIAYWLGSGPTANNMYDWKVYLRGVNGEDLSTFIKSVTFNLHASFRQSQRVIAAFPFEVKEQGWGEFEVEVKVEFKNDAEQPVSFNHTLKLHPWNGEPNKEDEPVVNEVYDEFVFNDPTELMYQLYPSYYSMSLEPLMHRLSKPLVIPPLPKESIYWVAFSESEALAILMKAQNYINQELLQTRDYIVTEEIKSCTMPSNVSRAGNTASV